LFLDPNNTNGNPAGCAQNNWFDVDRIGRYLPKTVILGTDVQQGARRVASAVMVCPSYGTETKRSYAMNIYASSALGDRNVPSGNTVPGSLQANGEMTNGQLFGLNVKNATKMLLITEKFVTNPITGPGQYDLYDNPTIGDPTYRPAQNFGAGPVMISRSGPNLSANDTPTAISWFLHRAAKVSAPVNVPLGRVNMGYVDGHVSLKSNTDVANFVTPRTLYDTLWSPKDYRLTNP
jgi:prepilin-type processing-associated H-X9-DG protein